jgi:hypothetical protein
MLLFFLVYYILLKYFRLITGIGVAFAVVAGGVAVVNAFASGALVTVATAVLAYIGIRYVIRCLR